MIVAHSISPRDDVRDRRPPAAAEDPSMLPTPDTTRASARLTSVVPNGHSVGIRGDARGTVRWVLGVHRRWGRRDRDCGFSPAARTPRR
jgi:hypothetical protein